MGKQNLKQKAASGMVWTSIQKFTIMGINFISGIILARLLTPDDYGCIGMLSIFMTVANSIINGGFGSALIQKKRPTQEDYSTVFFFNMGMSLFIYIILFVSAPAISRFYRMPLLCTVLRVQGLVLIIHAFSIIQSNQLRKQLRFKKLAIVHLVTSIISLSVTIILAYQGFGVWALVSMNMLSAIIPALIFWLTNKWYPILVFSKKSFKELFNFGFFMFLTTIINNLCNNVQGLLIGRFYNAATMGYYSKARNTEHLASTSISNVMGQVTFPLYAEYQNNKPLLINVVKRITCSIAYITFPMMLLLILLAKPIFLLLYSERWLNSVPYFQILCLAGIAVCLQGVNYQVVAAIGKSKQMFSWTIVKRAIGLAFVIGGMVAFGIYGLLAGSVISAWTIYLINAFQVHKYVGYTMFRQIKDILPVIILSVVAYSVAYGIHYLLPTFHIYVLALIQLMCFIVIYFACSVIFKMESYQYVKENIPIVLGKIIKRK